MRCACGHLKEEHVEQTPSGCLHRDLRKLCKCEAFKATSALEWGRSSDGYCTSKDGKWKIVPLYCGRVKPQMYELRYDGKREGWHTTQRLAKERAEMARERLRILGKI